MRWFAIGDPQTSLARLLAVLAASSLLDGDRLRDDVGLVSLGDHFDYGPGGDEVAREGLAVLTWLASHAPAQVVILFGNHDVARVQELEAYDDERFARANQAAQTPVDEERFLAEFPGLPTSECARRDFSGFSQAQRELVERLLREGRAQLAATALVDEVPILLTHASVSRRECEILNAWDVPSLGSALNRFLAERVAQWREGALDLAPLHQHGISGREGGGLLYHRAVDPSIYPPEELQGAWRRRYPPLELPDRVLQACGHVTHDRSLRQLAAYVAEDAKSLAFGALRALVIEQGCPRYGAVPQELKPTMTAVLYIDGSMKSVAPERYALLPLTSVEVRK